MTHNFEQLEKLLNYQFVNSALLELALTHSSSEKNNNERIEFLGDSIVNFIIGNDLFNRFPEAQEGQLSQIRATLVRGETLALLAQGFKISNVLIVGPGEMRTNGEYRHSILAGTMEAIIGAVYLDSNFETCRACVLNWYQPLLENISLDQQFTDAKTQLQELLQAKKMALPKYSIINQKGGAHKQFFIVECSVEGLKITTQGQGSNRRQAEQAAAALMIEKMNNDK